MAMISLADAPQWIKWVTEYDTTLQRLDVEMTKLKNSLPSIQFTHPVLFNYANSVIKRAYEILNKMSKFNAVRDKIKSWIGELRGNQAVHGLGVVPIIFIGVTIIAASAALAFISNVLRDIIALNKRIEYINQLQAKGMRPEVAAQMADKAFNGKIGIDNTERKNYLPWIIGGVALIVIIPMITRR